MTREEWEIQYETFPHYLNELADYIEKRDQKYMNLSDIIWDTDITPLHDDRDEVLTMADNEIDEAANNDWENAYRFDAEGNLKKHDAIKLLRDIASNIENEAYEKTPKLLVTEYPGNPVYVIMKVDDGIEILCAPCAEDKDICLYNADEQKQFEDIQFENMIGAFELTWDEYKDDDPVANMLWPGSEQCNGCHREIWYETDDGKYIIEEFKKWLEDEKGLKVITTYHPDTYTYEKIQ